MGAQNISDRKTKCNKVEGLVMLENNLQLREFPALLKFSRSADTVSIYVIALLRKFAQ